MKRPYKDIKQLWAKMASMRWEEAFRQRVEELALAFTLLTRIPLPPFEWRFPVQFGAAVWAYPLMGALIGGLGVAIFWLAGKAGLGPASTLLLAICAMTLTSGAFHEDGLADFWDGLGGGRSRETKLAIMHDSRIGAYGVLALVFAIGLQISLLLDIHAAAGAGAVAGAILAAEAAARGAMALPLASLRPARKDGLAASIKPLALGALLAACGLSGIIAAGALGVLAVGLLIGVGLGAALVSALAWRFLGGFTGDVLGAAVVTARVTGLAFLAWAMQL